MASEWAEMVLFSLRQTAAEFADAALDDALDRAQQHHERLMLPVTASCLTTFVAHEADWAVEGTRGYGRTSQSVPRFAGWQRQRLQTLEPAERQRLQRLIARPLLSGYATAVLMEGAIRKRICQPERNEEDALFAQWTSLLYRDGGKRALAPYEPLLADVTAKEYDIFLESLGEMGLGVGFLARPKLFAIVRGYVESGALLRMAESLRHYRKEVEI